jgi:hypothetical protein
MDFELIPPETSEAVEPHTIPVPKVSRKLDVGTNRGGGAWRDMVLTPGGETVMTNPTKTI